MFEKILQTIQGSGYGIIALAVLVAAIFVSRYFASKANMINQDNCIEWLNEIITDCVIYTNQVFVNSLKEEGKFDTEAAKKAFEMTLEKVKEQLSEEIINQVTKYVGDFDSFVTTLIEKTVNEKKSSILTCSNDIIPFDEEEEIPSTIEETVE